MTLNNNIAQQAKGNNKQHISRSENFLIKVSKGQL